MFKKQKKNRFVEFTGSMYEYVLDEKVWKPNGRVYVNPRLVNAFYEHTILIGNSKIRVMESMEQIREILEGGAE